MAEVVSYLWDFGDGTTSTLREPEHEFTMPGVYIVTLTVSDENGNSYISNEYTIRVYDYKYDDPAAENASKTNKCYMVPTLLKHGLGPAEYKDHENAGYDWVWPAAGIGTVVAYDEQRKEVGLVLDAKTDTVYQVNRTDVWKDRQNDDYGGSQIKAELWHPGEASRRGEHVKFRHTEEHLYFAPYDRDLRNTDGFDSEGYPTDMRVDVQLMKDGEPANPQSKAVKVPKDGDIVTQEVFDARSIQPRTIIYGAPWKLKGLQNQYDSLDVAAVPSLRQMTEETYQEHLCGLPLFWVSRHSFTPKINLATGEEATGTVDSQVEGPDSISWSGMYFSSNFGLSDTLPESLSGNFTLMVWLRMVALGGVNFRMWDIGTLHIELVNVGGSFELQIDDGVNPAMSVSVDFTGTEWEMFTIVRDGLYLRAYEGEALLRQWELGSVEDYGTALSVATQKASVVFDPRLIPFPVSAEEVEYAYENKEHILPDNG